MKRKMKKNNIPCANLTSASSTRASTAEEIEYLKHRLQQTLSPRKRLLKAILNTLVMWGGALLGLLLISGVASSLAHYSELLSQIISYSGTKKLVIVGTALYALFSTYRWLTTTENTYPLILQDITDATVVDETYPIQAVCRFQEPEMGGFIYLLKISEQAIFVLYDYQSQTKPDNVFLIQDKLILSKASHCDHYVKRQFTGEPLIVKNTYPLTLPPEQWPVPNTWLSMSWLDITSYFSQKQ
jgi:hypothetical protein